MLIGLAARARCGKDTVADYLCQKHDFNKLAFAAPVKAAAQAIFGLTDEETWGDACKEQKLQGWLMSPREMFQLVGTELCRNGIRQDIWLVRMEKTIADLKQNGRQRIVISDIRFENEAALIRSMGGVVWHIDRPAAPLVTGHVSESGVAHESGDVVLHNDDGLMELYCGVDGLL